MDWKQALYAARDEHDQLIQKRDEIDAKQADLDTERETLEKRILQLQQTITSLSELVGETHLQRKLSRTLTLRINNLTLANAIRKVLQSANKYWTPIEVRDMLQLQGYQMSEYSNALASIHAVLKRLRDSDEALRIAGADGKAMYRWKDLSAATPMPPPRLNLKVPPSNVLMPPPRKVTLPDAPKRYQVKPRESDKKD